MRLPSHSEKIIKLVYGGYCVTYADSEEYLNSPADFILIHCKYNLFSY